METVRTEAHPEGHRRHSLTSTPTGGRILSAMQIPWFTVFPPQGFGVLTTIGRTTGRRRQTCIRAVRVGDVAYLTAISGPRSGWLRNLRADPSVRLRVRGGTFAGTARELYADEEEVARRAYCEARHPLDWIEHVVHMPGRPTRERIRALHEHWFTNGSPVAIDLHVGRR